MVRPHSVEKERIKTRALVEFLNQLTGEFPEQTMPRLPPTPNTTLIDL